MMISFLVNDIGAVSYIINQFCNYIDGYELERNPQTGEPEMIVLFVKDGFEESAKEIKELIELHSIQR